MSEYPDTFDNIKVLGIFSLFLRGGFVVKRVAANMFRQNLFLFFKILFLR